MQTIKINTKRQMVKFVFVRNLTSPLIDGLKWRKR